MERSTDGINWLLFKKVDGFGNSTSLVNYSLLDCYFESNINYYKLSQVDYSGLSETFNITSVDNTKVIKKVIRVINTSGQEVTINTSGLIIIIYDDGSIIKIVNP